MSVIGSNILAGASGQAVGYQVERSLRFNSSDSAYLSRTPASAGNRKTWTWAGWVKRVKFGTDTWLLRANSSGSDFFLFGFSSANNLYTTYTAGVSAAGENYTNAVCRDPSAWYHILCTFDTTQSTATDRVKLYINGVLQSLAVSNPPTLNADYQVNSTNLHSAGGFSGFYADFYLADIHFIDGQALDPTSFTEVSATTGQLIPKAYTGTFGTNGFWLKFSDNSNNTAATLGKDYSPNGNNWTPNNLSVTAGAGNDSLVDTPTSYGTDTGVGGEVRGNYCTWNPIAGTGGSGVTFSNGNLDVSASTGGGPSGWRSFGSTFLLPGSGKWYVEQTIGGSGAFFYFGITKQIEVINSTTIVGNSANSYAINVFDGTKVNNSSSASYGSGFATNDVVMMAIDQDSGKIWWGKNGSWFNSGAPASGTNEAFSGLTGGYVIATSLNNGHAAVTNFGQRPFAYTAPSGFKALCDTNLPAPVVAKGSSAFDALLYTGNGASRSITGLSFNPDLVWIKERNAAADHALYDAVRGVQIRLESNTTDAEVATDGGVTAFNSDGFSLGTLAQVNTNADTYVAWAWDAGSSTVTNTAGSITSQVRANASAGFSIVSWTPQASAGTVGHGLNVAPEFIITKDRATANGWFTYHKSLGIQNYLVLNLTNAVTSNATVFSTAPTSTVFNQGSGFTSTIGYGNQICYCFAPVAGYTSAGSYTGNGSADGPFVYTSMRPRWILLKRTDSTGNWTILDTAREGYNVDNDPLFPNLANAEGTTDLADILSNGFKLRSTDASVNASGGTYIYYAISETAFQYSRAR